ncbi:MAG: S-layer homology domain-containing protein [Clostridiaceae bacterium]|nr:S-layer homology domain-containing protein [Clostridiaceae bacterium]
MKFKRFALSLIAFSVIVSMVFTCYAVTFPDILERHSWAADYIDDMVSRGLLKGYTDGTFKPDNPISKLEAVILAARILGVTYDENQEFAEAALSAYQQELAAYDIQYKKEAAYLLYWGSLRINELPDYIGDNTKNTPMNRHGVAKMLTKVLGGEVEALSNPIVLLNYADDNEIPTAAKPYIQFISDSGIMKGMEDNKFMPKFNVTRAMMATMMYRCEEAMQLTTVNAAVLSLDNEKITAIIDGATTDVAVDEGITIRVDGLASPLSGITKGYNIRLHYQGNDLRMIEALSSRTQTEVSGIIKSLTNNKGVLSITLDTNTGNEDGSKIYTLSDGCTIIVDNVETIFSSLKYDYFVKMNLKNNMVEKIVAETKSYTKTGTIKGLDFSANIPVLTIMVKDGSSESFSISPDATITRNNVTDELRNLAVGDNATLSITAGLIKKIVATSVNKDVEGTIEEIVISSAPTITIKTGGVSTEYKVAANTAFYVETEESSIYDMRLGATATIVLKSENIDKITIKKTVVPSQVMGTVTSVNPVYNVLVLDAINPDNGQITSQTVVVRGTVKIVDNTSTKITTLKGITPGRSIIALGGLDNCGTCAVTTIIITE